MSEVLKQLAQRKSVRVFEDRPLGAGIRDKIIQAALQAPSAGNQMQYTILEIEDKALKQKLAISCDNQPFIAKAPLVLVFLADCQRWPAAYKAVGAPVRKAGMGDLMLAFADALIAAQNTVVAAHALGLGSCYIGDILENREEHMQLLHLAPHTVPACMVVYGYPTTQQQARPKPVRFAAQYMVQKNSYKPPKEEALRAMFAAAHPEEDFVFEEYLQKFCARKYMSAFAREMTRSAAEYCRQFAPFCEEEAH